MELATTKITQKDRFIECSYNEVSGTNVNLEICTKPTKLPIGRIKAITETRKPDVNEEAITEKTEYFYDMQGRIEKVESSRASDSAITIEEYSYDGNGNRLTANFDSAQSPIIATYDAQDRMLTYGDNIYKYTVNGALLSKTTSEGKTEYNYDAVGSFRLKSQSRDTPETNEVANLLKVKLPDNREITYQIDARGRRIGKKIDNVFIYGFIYGDQLNPIAKVDEVSVANISPEVYPKPTKLQSGVILERYVYGLKSNIPEYIVKDDKWYKIVSNHLGSPIMIVDFDESTVVKEFKYDTFGNVISETGDFEIPFSFAGGIYDKDTKLTRFGVRDYDSETGRWTSKEPLGFGGARNFYVYANNNGVNFIDLNGKNPTIIPLSTYFTLTPYSNRKNAVDSIAETLYCKTQSNNKENCSFQFKSKKTGVHYNSGITTGSTESCNPYKAYLSILTNEYEIVSDVHSHTSSGDGTAEDYSKGEGKDTGFWESNYRHIRNDYLGYFVSPKGWLNEYDPKDKMQTNFKKLKCICK